MKYKLNIKELMLSLLAIFVMFLPRKWEIMGIFSFRVFILLVLFLGFFLLHGRFRVKGFTTNPFFLLYISYYCIRYVLAGEIISMLGFLTDTVILYVLFITTMSEEKNLSLYIHLFLNVVSIYCILCIIETFTGFNIWNALGIVNGNSSIRYGLHRAYGSFTTSINNGVFLMLCFPFVFYERSIKNRQQFAKRINILIWLALICTLSRAPILMSVLLHIIWLWKDGIIVFIKKHFIAIGTILLLVFVLAQIEPTKTVFRGFINMFIAIFDEDTASNLSGSFGVNANGIGHRFYLYEWVWQSVIAANKWIGVGPNTIFNYSFVASQGSTHIKNSIENQYLAVLYRFGIIGLLITVIFFISCYIICHRRISNETRVSNRTASDAFQFRISSAFLVYFITLLTVGAADEYKMLFILFAISECWSKILMENYCNDNIR